MSRLHSLSGLLIAGCLCACGDPPKVVQGKVVSYQPVDKMLVVADEYAPESRVTVSVEGAEIGADPKPEDVVRVAYREQGGRGMALRVMNLTRQGELGKSAGAH